MARQCGFARTALLGSRDDGVHGKALLVAGSFIRHKPLRAHEVAARNLI
jgi:hypothetical protein